MHTARTVSRWIASRRRGNQKSSIEVTEARKPLPKQLGSKGKGNVLNGQIRTLLLEEHRLQSKVMEAGFADVERSMDAKNDGRRFRDTQVSRESRQPQSEKTRSKSKRGFFKPALKLRARVTDPRSKTLVDKLAGLVGRGDSSESQV